jgi:hypothetical protein
MRILFASPIKTINPNNIKLDFNHNLDNQSASRPTAPVEPTTAAARAPYPKYPN